MIYFIENIRLCYFTNKKCLPYRTLYSMELIECNEEVTLIDDMHIVIQQANYFQIYKGMDWLMLELHPLNNQGIL